ncbi:hypothetical protein TNCV_124511 [Trichonephila clavipes]|nr:hypothetical protein TNCV_124511 [Trichonephila clavipes]
MVTRNIGHHCMAVESIPNKCNRLQDVDQGPQRTTIHAHDLYLALSAQRHWRKTALHLAHDLAAVSGRISIQIVYRSLAVTGLYAWRPDLCVPLECIQQKRSVIVKLKTSVIDNTRMCSFQC